MIFFRTGDLFETACDIICLQVSYDGLTRTTYENILYSKYPELYGIYSQLCREHNEQALGKVFYYQCPDTDKVIALMFTISLQSYEASSFSMKNIEKLIKVCQDYNKTFTIPYKLGVINNMSEWDSYFDYIKDMCNFSDVDCEIVTPF